MTDKMEKENIPECSQNFAQNNLNAQSRHSNISQEIANAMYSFSNSKIPNATINISGNSNMAIFIRESNQISLSSILNNLPSSTSGYNHPQSLFLQALSKLNENTLSYVLTELKQNATRPFQESSNIFNEETKHTEISAPDSLTSAPPSYSFVLRQMAARRPRLMGTFIPSPSFVQHTPPPNYATAFDIYVDNHIAAPPLTRVYVFGFVPMLVVCQECGYTGMTVIRSKITICTHMCSLILCLLCCWVCAPLPYIMRSCKDVYHYCRNCNHFLGRYCPNNPDNR